MTNNEEHKISGANAFAVSDAVREHLESILSWLGHDPRDALSGWRSKDPLVVASLFAANGFPVFPCNLLKHPLTRNGLHDATTDLRTIYYWDRDKVIYGWCVRTGRYLEPDGPSGLWILDIDDAAGYARLAQLESELGPLTATWTLMSGREGGGEHRYFAPASHGPDMKTRGKALIAGKQGNIDQKGRGGYGVGGGSLHVSRARYYWADGRAPDEIPLAQLPPAWVDAMDKASDPAAPRSSVSRGRGSSPRPRHSNRGGGTMLGDGPNGGGFHGPINSLCINFFKTAGPETSAESFVGLLRRLIENADRAPGRDITRYLSAGYLDDAIESARVFVREQFYVE